LPHRDGIDDFRGGCCAPRRVKLRPGAAEDRLQILDQCGVLLRRQHAIEFAPVVVGDAGDVAGVLHAPLDLEAGRAGGDQLRQQRRQRQIAHGEGEGGGGPGVAAIRRQPGERFAAAVGAPAAVAAATRLVRGIKAEAAVGIAERAVHEDLDFNAGLAADARRLLQRQFARQHHTPESQRCQGARTGEVVHRKLRAGMQAQARKVPARDALDAQILHDDGIRAQVVEFLQYFDHAGKIAFLGQRVERDVHAARSFQRVRMRH